MRIQLYFTGRTTGQLYREAIADYARRIGHYLPFGVDELPDLKNTRSLSEEQQKEREADQVLALVQPSDVLVLLDERGHEYTSRELAAWLQAQMQSSARRLVLLVGGPYGFSPRVYAAARAQISLSRLTLSHQMVRLLLIEQVYRACTILKGEPYHHD